MQIFKAKTLDELIANFQSQIENRENKIKARISTLETEAGQIRKDIETETKTLVEAELSEDAAAQEKARKAIRKHNQRLTEVQDLIAAFRRELQNKSVSAKDIQKIREAAIKEHEQKLQKLKDLDNERISIEQQIKQLEDRVKQVSSERSRILDNGAVEKKLVAIKDFIDDRRIDIIPKDNRFDIERFLLQWVLDSEKGIQGTLYQHLRREEIRQREAEPQVTYLRPQEVKIGEVTPQPQPQPKTRSLKVGSVFTDN